MNERAKALADLGRRAYVEGFNERRMEVMEEGWTGYHKLLIDAIAVMLASPAAKKTKKPKELHLAFGPGELYERLKEQVSHLVLVEPVENRLFGFMGKRLSQIIDLQKADLERVVSWIEAGGTSYWTNPPTFEHACYHIGKWIAAAREWDRRGRPNLRKGGSNVGSGTTEPDVSGAFK